MEIFEIAELIRSVNMYEIAAKTNEGLILTSDEEKVVSQLDTHFKEIGKKGHDSEHEIASFIQKVINEEIYNTPDELLGLLFEQGTIGTFDDFEDITAPKNTLIAYDAAKGGNVPRSFLDIGKLVPTWKNMQIETDISFADLERDGWKKVSTITEFAIATFKNRMFAAIFDVIDAAIASGENYLEAAGAKPTQADMDAISLYINDRTESGVIVALSKYVQAASKLTGFVSDEMKNEVHRTGRLGTYDGVSLTPISSAKKLGDDTKLLKDKRMYGVAGKLGVINMKGEVKTYQIEDPNKEVFHIMFKDFTFGFAFNDTALENVFKMTLK
ncbi:MAG: hypothetical protein RR365_06195 [Bacteroides sp.]